MPKPRNAENKGLPARWQFIHGAYYFQVPPGLEAAWDGKKKFRLGKTLPEAYKVWADRLGSIDKANNVGQLLDRYGMEVVPTKAVRSQAENARAITKLRAVFGDLQLEDIKPQLVYQYVDKKKAKVAAHREIAVLSHAFTKAVEWGYIDRHPFKGEVRLKGEAPRTRYVEDWEVVECLALSSKRLKGSVLAIQAYMRMKLLTGLRRGDLLRLQTSDLRDDGIHVTPGKTRETTGKKIIIDWSDELREAVQMAKDARPVHIAPLLFCNKRGECYFDEVKGTASGWDSMWQRFMTRILEETKVEQRFTEHDLRAKCASDAETLEHAQSLLAHADGRLTDRVYRRKPERVKPLR
jgi:integrase